MTKAPTATLWGAGLTRGRPSLGVWAHSAEEARALVRHRYPLATRYGLRVHVWRVTPADPLPDYVEVINNPPEPRLF